MAIFSRKSESAFLRKGLENERKRRSLQLLPLHCFFGAPKVSMYVDITDYAITSIFPIPDVGITCLNSNLTIAEVTITDVGIILQTRSRYNMP